MLDFRFRKAAVMIRESDLLNRGSFGYLFHDFLQVLKIKSLESYS